MSLYSIVRDRLSGTKVKNDKRSFTRAIQPTILREKAEFFVHSVLFSFISRIMIITSFVIALILSMDLLAWSIFSVTQKVAFAKIIVPVSVIRSAIFLHSVTSTSFGIIFINSSILWFICEVDRSVSKVYESYESIILSRCENKMIHGTYLKRHPVVLEKQVGREKSGKRKRRYD